MMQAVLSNAAHPEYGAATIPFPIPRDEYDDCIASLKVLEIGSASKRDCKVDEICGAWPVLKRLEGTPVNLDELDYLTKRLDSFDVGEAAQFQAMAEKLDLNSMTDLINLTFCCQQATVIADFTDLEAVGRDHYLNLNGGCASTEDLNNLDGYETALLLIDSGAGTITPYGVVYDNGMKLDHIYDGSHLPEFFYENCIASISLSLEGYPDKCEKLYFPCADSKIDRALRRLGAERPSQCAAKLDTDQLCDAVRGMFEEEFELNEHLDTLNALARCYQSFDAQTLDKFHTVFDTAWPQTPEEALYLAENIYDFMVVDGVSTAEEYGRYMIQESGHFELDPNLEDYVDFESYGRRRIQEEHGILGDRGYVAYLGMDSEVKEIMARIIPNEQPSQGQHMGGIRME